MESLVRRQVDGHQGRLNRQYCRGDALRRERNWSGSRSWLMPGNESASAAMWRMMRQLTSPFDPLARARALEEMRQPKLHLSLHDWQRKRRAPSHEKRCCRQAARLDWSIAVCDSCTARRSGITSSDTTIQCHLHHGHLEVLCRGCKQFAGIEKGKAVGYPRQQACFSESLHTRSAAACCRGRASRPRSPR